MGKLGIKRLGSADSAFKNLKAVGETRWQEFHPQKLDVFHGQAQEAIQWLIDNSHSAWRYGAQYREVYNHPAKGQSIRIAMEYRHRVQFELPSDAMLFKLSYRP